MLVRFVYWVFIINLEVAICNRIRAMELLNLAAELGSTKAHGSLAESHRQRGDSKKTKLHYDAAAMAGDKVARYNIGRLEAESGHMDRLDDCGICWDYYAMHNLLFSFIKVFL